MMDIASLNPSYELDLSLVRHSGARGSANPESRDSGFDAFASPRNDVEEPPSSRSQHILLHLAAIKMEKRHRRVVAQRAGGEALFEFVENVPGHRMQVGQRLRSQ